MWEAAARAGPTVRHRATAASATPSTRWATAAGLLVVVVEFGSAALPALRAAATRRPPPSCWARARARPSERPVRASSGRRPARVRRRRPARVPRRGTSGFSACFVGVGRSRRLAPADLGICREQPLPGPCAACAPAPTRVLLGLEYGGRLPRMSPLGSGGCGPVLWPRYCVGAGHTF